MDTVVINEVGLRDGLQNQSRYLDTDQKIELFNALVRSGLKHLEVTSFVAPKQVPQLADADVLVRCLPVEGELALTALAPNEKGYERAKSAGINGIAVVLAATETLNRRNINMSRERALGICKSVIQQAKNDGKFARAYIAAAWACPYEGPTPSERVIDLAEQMFRAGADEVAVADTIGAGNPAQVERVMAPLVLDHGVDRVAAHFHDTRGMGLALAWAAFKCGVRRFDGSIAGLGGCPFAPGASGNIATEDLVFMFNDCGVRTGVNFEALLDAVAVAQRIVEPSGGGKIMSWARGRRKDAAAAVPRD